MNKIIKINNDKIIKFEIWDTAGEEKYRSVNRLFYQNAAACILVYDITRKSSFDELKKYWVNEVKENTGSDTSK
jgi:Ras-related protein Rab-11A